MTSLENLVFTLSGRIIHPFDFTFHKNSGEFANRARVELRSIAELAVTEVRIDDDGDVEIQTDKARFYLNPVGVVVGGLLTRVNDLSENIQAISRVVNVLAGIRGALQPEGYGTRLGFRFTPMSGLRLIREGGFDAVLSKVLSQNAPAELGSLEYSAAYRAGDFSDYLALEGSEREIQLRFSRDYRGTKFESFNQFLVAADLAAVCEGLRGFVETLGADERPAPARRAISLPRDRK
jgi:hypothetical protein